MQNSCPCSQCTKWKKMFCNTAKVNKRNQGSVKRLSWLERTNLFEEGLLQMARRCFKSDPKKDSSHNVTRIVQWRFVFFDSENEGKN